MGFVGRRGGGGDRRDGDLPRPLHVGHPRRGARAVGPDAAPCPHAALLLLHCAPEVRGKAVRFLGNAAGPRRPLGRSRRAARPAASGGANGPGVARLGRGTGRPDPPPGDGAALLVAAAIAGYATLFTLIYAALLLVLFRSRGVARPGDAGAPPSEGGVTRREMLSRGVMVALAATAGTAAARWVLSVGHSASAFAQSLFSRIKDLPPEITPNDRFYVVSKNPPGFDPELDAERWSLEIAGMVGRPLKLSYAQLRALPAVEQFQTLECISNEVGGDLISNARWKGVRLRDVLQHAGGPGTKAVKVAFHC